jgi:hypothetical protein
MSVRHATLGGGQAAPISRDFAADLVAGCHHHGWDYLTPNQSRQSDKAAERIEGVSIQARSKRGTLDQFFR